MSLNEYDIQFQFVNHYDVSALTEICIQGGPKITERHTLGNNCK